MTKKKLKDIQCRAGDWIEGPLTGSGHTLRTQYAYSDGVRVFGIGLGEQSLQFNECELLCRATDEEHVDALERLALRSGPSGEVLPERQQHGDVATILLEEKDKPAVEVSSSCGLLNKLHTSGVIGDAEVAAAQMWARDYETGIMGAKDPEASSKGGKPDPEYVLLARMHGTERCRYIREHLGKRSEEFLYSFLIDHMSISQVAGQRKRDRRQISGAIELLLGQLADVYAEMPGKLWFNIDPKKGDN
ncbi:hypothetical protein [Acetobacter pasteurianus]|uniref:hypothetical protein n=1 Tax=Acetobacter pasteurianus TaxID=438 RepID=UPI0003843CB1|nr:hypothetical protein [Acetobacter pasteurianus]CCT58527.1 hypothetical protein APA386B_410 [Acetobacter pasteurianus 386B]